MPKPPLRRGKSATPKARADQLSAESRARAQAKARKLNGTPLDYVQAGLVLCAIPRGQKGPTTMGWNLPGAYIKTPAQAQKLNGCNVGLLHVPSGTCAIDVDDVPRTRRLLAAEGIDLDALLDAPDAVQIEGRPFRAKLLYRIPEGVEPQQLVTRKIGAGAFELRCSAAAGLSVQDVLPPSMHPITGEPYRWAGKGDHHHLPELPQALLSLWLRVAAAQPAGTDARTDGGIWSEGERNDRLSAEAFRMRKQGCTVEQVGQLLLAINEARCAPPLPEDEVSAIARGKYGIAPDVGEWPEPLPIETELPDVPPFEASKLLPPTLAAFVMDEADRMPCPLDFVGVALLVCLGAVIGARCALKPKRLDDWIIPPNLWGGVVGDPATKKTPAMSAATRLLDRAERREAERKEDDRRIFKAELAAYEAHKAAIEGAIKRATASTDKDAADALEKAKAQHAELRPPDEPHVRRFKSNDATTEKLADLLVHNPAGLLVNRDEIVGLLSSFEREGHEGDRTFYLEGWNGTNSFSVDRIARGSLVVPNLCISVLGGIQPEPLERYLADLASRLGNDGLVQRFALLVYPDPTPWEWRDRPPNKDARSAVLEVFDRLATFDPVQDGAAPATDFVKLPAFSFDNDAQELFIKWEDKLHAMIAAEQNPLLAQHFAKFEKAFGAIALTLHLAAGNVGPVTLESATYAAHWCDYLEGHARRIYALVDAARVNTARMLTRKLREGKLPDPFTARQVVLKGWRGIGTAAQAEQALAVLEAHGWVVAVDVPPSEQGGRPTTHYHTNPAGVSQVSSVVAQGLSTAQESASPVPTKPTKRFRLRNRGVL